MLPSRGPRPRDPDRSRDAILDAAERLFAARGFQATSLADIGAAAGLSRGTPGYFFGSKQELYDAVLARAFGRARTAVAEGRARAGASGREPEAILAGLVGDYYDFLLANPGIVRLLEREALSATGRLEEASKHAQVLREALHAVAEESGLGADDLPRAAQLLLSIISLCWFPLVHGETVLRALGLDPASPEFHHQRRRHVIDLVLHGAVASLPTPSHGSSAP